jgi:hypothetical protein
MRDWSAENKAWVPPPGEGVLGRQHEHRTEVAEALISDNFVEHAAPGPGEHGDQAGRNHVSLN